MNRRLAELGTYGGGDTGYLSRYFSDRYSRLDMRRRLPLAYCVQREVARAWPVRLPPSDCCYKVDRNLVL